MFIFSFVNTLVSSYGFDSGGACEQRASRHGRAQLLASIPCDLSTQSYCNLPGSSYPWHAVRRFVHENQGLMKRMYGDIKHISVLKNEFEGNFIETDDIEIAIDRYSNKKQQRAMKLGDKKNRRSDTIAEPHFRLQSTTTTSKVSPTTTKSTISRTATTQIATTVVPESNSTVKFAPENIRDKYVIENESKLGEAFDQITTTLPSSTGEESINVVTLTSNINDTSKPSTTSNMAPSTTPATPTTLSTTQTLLSQEVSLEELEGHNNSDQNHTDDESEEDLDYSDRSPHPNAPTMEGQLFQDTVTKATSPPVNARGV